MITVIKKILCISLSICLSVLLCGCNSNGSTAANGEKMTKTWLDFFDTVTQIIGYEDDSEAFDENCEELYELLEEYHQLTDIYHSYDGVNNVRTINKNAGVEPVSVDEKLIDLLEFAKEMYTETDGKCNIAMGSVLSIWHTYREQGTSDPENASLPPMESLEAASEHCDIDKLIIDRDVGTVFLADEEMSLDLGAVAKGYAVERAAELLMQKGITTGYTINIGGNIRTLGKKGDSTDWKAGIQNPDTTSDTSYVIRLTLNNAALVTSGNYQRYYTVDGVRYHHIIDPETLMPARYFDSVSVLAADSGTADALSTALFNMSVEDGKALLADMDGIEAFWIMSDGSFEYTDGFADYISE
jgi:thiamine biosynthesis lipoprotein